VIADTQRRIASSPVGLIEPIKEEGRQAMRPILDPRQGDVED
jgi:hypothetical protein